MRGSGTMRPMNGRARSGLAAMLVLLTLPLVTGWSFFDPFHEKVEKGNRHLEAGDPKSALDNYDEAAREDPGNPIPDYNAGIALTRLGRTDEAAQAFRRAAAVDDKRIAAYALFNEGNAFFEAERYREAVDSYLKSLDLVPDDNDVRKNLEIAWQRLEEQQQQQQQQQQDQDQQNQDQQDQEQQQNQDQQDQNQQNQDQQNQDQQDQQDSQSPQDEEDQDSQQSDQQSSADEPQPSNPDEEQQPPRPQDQMSREDAERLLNAVQSDELKVLQKLQDDTEKDTGGVTDDW